MGYTHYWNIGNVKVTQFRKLATKVNKLIRR